MLKIDFDYSQAEAALNRLVKATTDIRPAFVEIGERLVEVSKQSFERSASPDGQAWVPNSPATIIAYLGKISGSFKKDGKLSKKGIDRTISKKPLIGKSRDLSRQFSYSADESSLVVRNTQIYAAIQQFGGTKSAFPKLWGDIPARPFMPLNPDGSPSPVAEKIVLEIVERHIADALPE
ncbi:MAG: phage virion morphogenesis protein [Burkholderiaceae bacterium]|nr:phage virion morphogenesis protein [Burkholderiaceae bacterium]